MKTYATKDSAMAITRYVLGVLLLLHLSAAGPGVLRESVVLRTGQSRLPSEIGFSYNTRTRTSRLEADIQYEKISLLPFFKSDNKIKDKALKEREEVFDSEPITVPSSRKTTKDIKEVDDGKELDNRFLKMKQNRTTTVAPVTRKFTTRRVTITETPFKPSQSQLEELFGKLSTPSKRQTTALPDSYRPLPAAEKDNPRPIQRTRLKEGNSGENPVTVPTLVNGNENGISEQQPQVESHEDKLRKPSFYKQQSDSLPSRKEDEEVLKDVKEKKQQIGEPSRLVGNGDLKNRLTEKHKNEQSADEGESDLWKLLSDVNKKRERESEKNHPYLRNRGKDQLTSENDHFANSEPTQLPFPDSEIRKPDRLPRPASREEDHRLKLREEEEDYIRTSSPQRETGIKPGPFLSDKKRSDLPSVQNDKLERFSQSHPEENHHHPIIESSRNVPNEGLKGSDDKDERLQRTQSYGTEDRLGIPEQQKHLGSEGNTRDISHNKELENSLPGRGHLVTEQPSSFHPSSTSRSVRNDGNRHEDDGLDNVDIPPALKALLRSLDGQSPFQNLQNRVPPHSQQVNERPIQPTVHTVQVPMVNIRPKGMHGMHLPSNPQSRAEPGIGGTSTPIPPRIFTPPIYEYSPPSPRMHVPKQDVLPERSEEKQEQHSVLPELEHLKDYSDDGQNLDFHGPYSSAKTYIVPNEEVEKTRGHSVESSADRLKQEFYKTQEEKLQIGHPLKQYENNVLFNPPSSHQRQEIREQNNHLSKQFQKVVFDLPNSSPRPLVSFSQSREQENRPPIGQSRPRESGSDYLGSSGRASVIESARRSQQREPNTEYSEPSRQYPQGPNGHSFPKNAENGFRIAIHDGPEKAEEDRPSFEGRQPQISYQLGHGTRHDDLNQKGYSGSKLQERGYPRPLQKSGSRQRRPKDPVIIRQSVGAALGGGSGHSVINVFNAHPSSPQAESYYEKENRYKEMYVRWQNLTNHSQLRTRADLQSLQHLGAGELNRRSISDDTEENQLRSSKRTEPLVFADLAWSPDDNPGTPHENLEDGILAALSHLGPRKQPNFDEGLLGESENPQVPSRQISLNLRDSPLNEHEELQDKIKEVLGSIARDEENVRSKIAGLADGERRPVLDETDSQFQRRPDISRTEIGLDLDGEGRIPSRQISINLDSEKTFDESDDQVGPNFGDQIPLRQFTLNSDSSGAVRNTENQDRGQVAARPHLLSLEPERKNGDPDLLDISRIRLPASQNVMKDEEEIRRVPSGQFLLNQQVTSDEDRPFRQFVVNSQTSERDGSSLRWIEQTDERPAEEPFLIKEERAEGRLPSRQHVLNQQFDEVNIPLHQYVTNNQPARNAYPRQKAGVQETADAARDDLSNRNPIRQYVLRTTNPLTEDVVNEQKAKERVPERALMRHYSMKPRQRPVSELEEIDKPSERIPTRQFLVNPEIEDESLRVKPLEEIFQIIEDEKVPRRQFLLKKEPETDELIHSEKEITIIEDPGPEEEGRTLSVSEREEERRESESKQEKIDEDKSPVVTSHFVLFPRPEPHEPETQVETSSGELQVNTDAEILRSNPKDKGELPPSSDQGLSDIPVFPIREIVIVTPKPDKSLIRTEAPSFIFVEKKVRPDGVVLESIKGNEQFMRNGQSPTLLRLPSLDGIDGPVTLVLHDLKDLKNRTEDEQIIQTAAPFLSSDEQVVTPGVLHVSKVYFSPDASQVVSTEKPYVSRTEPSIEPQWRPLNVFSSSAPTPLSLQVTTERPVVYAPVSPAPVVTTPRIPIKPSALIYHGPSSETPLPPGKQQLIPLVNQNGVAKLQGHVVTQPANTKYGYPKSVKGKPFSEVPFSAPISWKPEMKWKGSVGSVMAVKPSKLTKMIDLFSPNLIRPSRTASKDATTRPPDFIKKIKPRNDGEAVQLVKLRVPIPVNYTSDTKKIIGRPGKDYPAYAKPPSTNFQCSIGGLFADIESRCQIFHKCDGATKVASFICPKGTIYDQQTGICDWWYEVATCGL